MRQPDLRAEDLAFFLDVDGTLLEFAATPDAVAVDAELIELLRALMLKSNGAVALVSGRAIATLDRLFEPLLLPAAGLHGFERRNAGGIYCRQRLPAGQTLDRVRQLFRQIASHSPGVLVEDKRFALALHYRQAPTLEPLIIAQVEAIARTVDGELEIQRGRFVAELRPAGANKASAIAAFMLEEPFAGRRPVCLGDDLTDECAFAWVNAAGGLSLSVGSTHDTVASTHLPSVRTARTFLRRIVLSEGVQAAETTA